MSTRDELIKKMKNQLDELNTGIEKIEKRAESIKDEVKGKLQVRITLLRKKKGFRFCQNSGIEKYERRNLA